jgi:hypothetical protein
MTRLRRTFGLLLPRGPKARELGLEFNGEIPDGWTTVKSRRAEHRKRKKKELKKRHAKVEADASARGAPPPPEIEPPPAAEEPEPPPADEFEHLPF